MKTIILILVLLCSTFAHADTSDKNTTPPDCAENDTRPRCQFEFDEEGRIRTKSGEAEKTFSFPPLKTGFILDFGVPDFLPYVALQLFSWDLFGESFAIDIGGSSGRMFFSLDWEAVPIMKLGPCIWAGWNVPREEVSFGIGFTVLKF